MHRPTSRCQDIIDLIDRCLAEYEPAGRASSTPPPTPAA